MLALYPVPYPFDRTALLSVALIVAVYAVSLISFLRNQLAGEKQRRELGAAATPEGAAAASRVVRRTVVTTFAFLTPYLILSETLGPFPSWALLAVALVFFGLNLANIRATRP